MSAVAATETQSPPPAVPFAQALRFWLRLGFISFGGPAGQIAIMHRELVEQRRWISERRFLHSLNYCMLLPGPEAQQLATYIGWLMHRTWGGVAAGALFVLPSLFILIALSWVYLRFGDVPLVAGLFYGIKPAVAAIVLHAVWRIGSRTLRSPRRTPALWAIALLSFLAIAVLGIPFPWVVLGAALAGWAGARWAPGQFSIGGAHGGPAAGKTWGPALIDDDTPTPPHARFSRARLGTVVVAGAVLWAAPMGLLVAAQGAQGTLAQMGWFFTKAALLTFGGAYAVLPYVYQGAVEHFQWLTGPQMIDGLALGETTPGPLIMVVAFVGFVGGWAKQVLGPEALFLGAALAACVATWFTFLPSFLFILAGGPLVESTHGQLKFTAPLTAITAAVVGVIATLALFFLAHIARPQGGGGVDLAALGLALLAAVALFRFKAGVIPVILGCALAGLALRLLGWA
ncbi:chromate efflux transporter [Ramlibacter tataouinensis]|uniref:Candidate chromate transport protein, full length n=1 Tax=Ramlibacter tataouinensis (strain ATCC BAA-407 / DSM 14655 / LMG 21543 / TTB310) TaxID=365046 RepID=F5Y339_RAMTT|nr:chromate efflux transporter [Ramlibacter tataouinensis]AEG94919.1 Candidate chromate transport protein, full length [Ramlibacter tataouinensis TTB310]